MRKIDEINRLYVHDDCLKEAKNRKLNK
jgi:hypothetical protein